MAFAHEIVDIRFEQRGVRCLIGAIGRGVRRRGRAQRGDGRNAAALLARALLRSRLALDLLREGDIRRDRRCRNTCRQ